MEPMKTKTLVHQESQVRATGNSWRRAWADRDRAWGTVDNVGTRGKEGPSGARGVEGQGVTGDPEV